MENKDSKSCSFLCFRNCRKDNEEPESRKVSPSNGFQKLSLKKMKEDRYIVRTSSFKRIDRPIPTTQRSQQEGAEVYLTQLVEKKKRVQRQIDALNNDFDRYYQMYASKLKELKELQVMMNQQFKDKIRK